MYLEKKEWFVDVRFEEKKKWLQENLNWAILRRFSDKIKKDFLKNKVYSRADKLSEWQIDEEKKYRKIEEERISEISWITFKSKKRRRRKRKKRLVEIL